MEEQNVFELITAPLFDTIIFRNEVISLYGSIDKMWFNLHNFKNIINLDSKNIDKYINKIKAKHVRLIAYTANNRTYTTKVFDLIGKHYYF